MPLPKKVTSRKHARQITTAYHAITEKLHTVKGGGAEQARLRLEPWACALGLAARPALLVISLRSQ